MKFKINLDIGGLLLLLFVGLKLCNVINWSWWWVMAPLWVPLSFASAILSIILLTSR